MRIPFGVTGTQRGGTAAQLTALHVLLTAKPPHLLELHHGGCIGVDEEAWAMAKRLGIYTIAHPPTDLKKASIEAIEGSDERREPLPYLERNNEIVKAVRILIVVPRTEAEEIRSGTWTTYRRAKAQRKGRLIILPNGRVQRENG